MSSNHSRIHPASRFRLILMVLAVQAAGIAFAVAPPPEVGGLNWCSASKDCLQWNAAAGATTYKLYTGRLVTLPDLVAASPDSCLVSALSSTTTGPVLLDKPQPCALFWYLVTAQNSGGEGSPGDASAGPRSLDSVGSCLVSCSPEAASCVNHEDCCSGRCYAGVCDEACCREGGAQCTVPADCCSDICSGGACAARVVCPYGQTNCSGSCVSVLTDPANCGRCGHACTTGQGCGSGTCAPLSAVITGSIPTSPSNTATTFNLLGTAVGSTVSIYSNSACSGTPVSSATPAVFGSTGIAVSVVPNSAKTFYAKASDNVGNSSACSAGFTVIHDSIEATPVFMYANPASPSSTATRFNLIGTADTGAGAAPTTVFIHSNSACSGSPVNTGTAASFGSTGIMVTIAPNSAGTFYAKATDTAGNISGCSAGITVIHDSVEATPVFTATSPPSPSRTATTFNLIGTADTGPSVAPTTVRIFSNSSCTGTHVNSGTAATFGSTGIAVTIAPSSSGTFYAKAIDAAGNTSGCSTGITVTNDPNLPLPDAGVRPAPGS